MIFNGIEKDYLTVLRDLNRPAWAPIERELITVPGMSGAHLSHSKRQVREITVPVFLRDEDFGDLQKIKEDLAEWLIHDVAKELKFKDEPDRTYYAFVDGGLDLDEMVKWGEGVITFICPDPYKYGPEESKDVEDNDIIENKGTADADPIIELTTKKKSTFALISLGADEDSEYNLIGTPTEVDEEVVDNEHPVFVEYGETLENWNEPGSHFDNGKVTGDQLGFDGTGIHPLSYGDPGDWEKWYGPAKMQEINPIQDFEVEMRLRVNTTKPNELYRIEFYLYDESMNEIGKMAIRDFSLTVQRYAAEGRVGEFKGAGKNYLISQQNYLRESSHFHGLVRMRRIGNEFEFYVARLKTGDDENGKHHDILKVPFLDINNEYQGRLKYVQINISRHAQGSRASVPRINSIRVKEFLKYTVDQTPNIVYPGDVITFDHKVDDILINGEPRNDLKNFGGSFFTLKKGLNNLIVTPSDSFDTRVTYRDKYL